jgi:hypothetical protein
LKTTLIKYGHDNRLYGGEVRLQEFDTEFSEFTAKGSYWANKIIADWCIDDECEFFLKCRNRSRIKDSDATHPWRRTGGMFR